MTDYLRDLVDPKNHNWLLKRLVTVDQARRLISLLEKVIRTNVLGDIVELGCFEGTTTVLLQRVRSNLGSKKSVHAYDSFQGLPPANQWDSNILKAGALKTTPEAFTKNVIGLGGEVKNLHIGWFNETLPKELPLNISFALLDGDRYSSTMEGLTWVYPRLSPGAVVMLDDYGDPRFCGVKKACDQFLPGAIQVKETVSEKHYAVFSTGSVIGSPNTTGRN